MKTQISIRGHLLKNSFIFEINFLSSYKLLIYKVLADYFCGVCTMTSESPKFSNSQKQRRTYINILEEKTTLQKDPEWSPSHANFL